MQYVARIASNTFYQILARVSSSGISFIITIIVAQSLGVALYGDYAKVIGFVSLFYLLVDLGLNAIFVQEEHIRVRFKDVLSLRLLLAMSIFLLANVASKFLPYNELTHIGFSPLVQLGIFIFSFTVFTEAITYTATAIFQKELAYKFVALSSILGSAATLLGVTLVYVFSVSLLLILAAFVVGGLVKAGLSLLFTKEGLIPFRIDALYAKQLFVQTLPLTLMLVCNLIYFRIDMLILAAYHSSQAVAMYDLAYKFFDFLIALPLFLSNSLYPGLIENEKRQRINLAKTFLYMGLFFILSLVILIPAWFLSPYVSLINPAFAPASLPLRILLLSLPVFFVTNILQWLLVVKKQQKFLAIVYALVAIVNIAANLVFIPQFSYIAASTITGVSELLVMVLLLIRLMIV